MNVLVPLLLLVYSLADGVFVQSSFVFLFLVKLFFMLKERFTCILPVCVNDNDIHIKIKVTSKTDVFLINL